MRIALKKKSSSPSYFPCYLNNVIGDAAVPLSFFVISLSCYCYAIRDPRASRLFICTTYRVVPILRNPRPCFARDDTRNLDQHTVFISQRIATRHLSNDSDTDGPERRSFDCHPRKERTFETDHGREVMCAV